MSGGHEILHWARELVDGYVYQSLYLTDEESSTGRTLATQNVVENGEILIRIPFTRIVTIKSALETLGKELALVVLQLCGNEPALVPKPTVGCLLMALQLLSEIQTKSSKWKVYLKHLPSPKLGQLTTNAVTGPRLVHLLLFEECELAELQNESLAEAMSKEKSRLFDIYTRLSRHWNLMIDFDDFVWANCIVRTRALDLSLLQEHVDGHQSESFQCMIPITDLCNHSEECNCTLRMCKSHEGHVNAIELVAQRQICHGEELSLDYGHRSLRDFLRVYGFVPNHFEARSEVFEDPLNPLESVFVNGNRNGSFFSLGKVILLESPYLDWLFDAQGNQDGHLADRSMLETALESKFLLDRDGCTCMYEVREESGDSPLHMSSFKDSPKIVGVKVHSCCSWQDEIQVITRMLTFCSTLLKAMPTTLEYDLSLQDSRKAPSCHHHRLAIQYRSARKKLLMNVIDDLHTNLTLLKV